MLSNIIKQIQNERDQDKRLSKQIGTNQKHQLTNIPGHRKITPNAIFQVRPMVVKATIPKKQAPEPIEPSGAERLAAALADLPRQQRAAVALYYLDGLSVAETAAALGLSDGAVKFHLHEARARLRTLLGDLHDGGR